MVVSVGALYSAVKLGAALLAVVVDGDNNVVDETEVTANDVATADAEND